MTERPIGVEDVAAGAGVVEYRTRERSVGGATVVEQYLLYVNERVASCHAMASTFRVVGSGVAAQVFATLFNKAGSGVLVAVRRMTVQNDFVSNTGTVRVFASSRLTTAPTTGTVITPTKFDTADTQSASVEFRSGASADGTASAITAPAIAPAFRQIEWRGAEAPPIAGQLIMEDEALIPRLAADDPVILAEGEGISAYMPDVQSASMHTVINCMWEEFTLP